jgi:hypothetical protein
MRRVLLFVGAFDVLLVRCRCFLVTLLHRRGCPVVAFMVLLKLESLLNGNSGATFLVDPSSFVSTWH